MPRASLRAPPPTAVIEALGDEALATNECLTEAPDGGAADACLVLDPEFTLRRYLQLRTVLSGEPLPDAAVLSLIRKVEAADEPVRFNEDKIWGDWQLVWQLNTAAATKSQKALAPLPQYSNFIVDERGTKVFRNIVQVTRRRMRVVADVAYEPPPEGSETPGRIGSVISAAGLELSLGRRFGWKPLRLPLPLNGEGWLEVTHLSNAMRITRGNRGGIFVHLRPQLLTRNAAWPLRGGSSGPHRMAGRR